MPDVHHWKTLIALAPDQELKSEGSRMAGFMAEEDVDTYAVVGSDGVKAGEVVVRDHTNVKGFKRTIRVTQSDAAGKQLLDTAYNVSK
ncbi:hypothetical protein [Roseateles sp.]|uniref:hypothetical protein n=1 Tax=Roseateles sp. TaxID=1971397 RepID=UPI003BAA305F